MKKEKYSYEKGIQLVNNLNENLVEDLKSLGDLGDYILEFGFGEVFQREHLNLREKEIATLSILISQGRETQIEYHFKIALQIGMEWEELEDLIIQTSLYSGFPTAMIAMKILKKLKENVNSK